MITQREFFNSMAEKWDTVCQHDKDKIRYILSFLGIKKGSKVLDVGTGTGVLIPHIWKQVGNKGEITAIDISEKMIEVAQRKYSYENVKFLCSDVLKVDFKSEYFDFVVCYSVFPHFYRKQLAIDIMSKYLKKGGKFIICHSQSREAINNLHKKTSEAVAEDNLPSATIIKNFLENANMKLINIIDNDEMFVVISEK